MQIHISPNHSFKVGKIVDALERAIGYPVDVSTPELAAKIRRYSWHDPDTSDYWAHMINFWRVAKQEAFMDGDEKGIALANRGIKHCVRVHGRLIRAGR